MVNTRSIKENSLLRFRRRNDHQGFPIYARRQEVREQFLLYVGFCIYSQQGCHGTGITQDTSLDPHAHGIYCHYLGFLDADILTFLPSILHVLMFDVFAELTEVDCLDGNEFLQRFQFCIHR